MRYKADVFSRIMGVECAYRLIYILRKVCIGDDRKFRTMQVEEGY